ncbi:MAG: dTDP-4-dehydrorhamnose reductase [Syntrophobacteraceae bacterium]
MESCLLSDFRAIVIGGGGMLGGEVVEGLKAAGFQVEAPPKSVADITNRESMRSLLGRAKAPGLVINCAGYTAVDKAESEQEAAFALNRDGPGMLADECRERGLHLIHISTDYIFNGRAERPYREDDPADPLSIYGRSKWEGEEAVRSRLPAHIVVRTSWLYGARGTNFVKTMLRLAGEREELRVVSDQHGCPTWTRDLAGCLVRIADRIFADPQNVQWGTYHFCCGGVTTWFDFARAIVDAARERGRLKAVEVIPVSTASYPTPAARPMWSVLDCRKIREKFGISPPAWETGLARMLDELWLVQTPCAPAR